MRKKALIEVASCVACGACTKVCPKEVISVYKGMYAVVDSDRCVGCGLCAKTCPAGAISLEVINNV